MFFGVIMLVDVIVFWGWEVCLVGLLLVVEGIGIVVFWLCVDGLDGWLVFVSMGVSLVCVGEGV